MLAPRHNAAIPPPYYKPYRHQLSIPRKVRQARCLVRFGSLRPGLTWATQANADARVLHFPMRFPHARIPHVHPLMAAGSGIVIAMGASREPWRGHVYALACLPVYMSGRGSIRNDE